MAVQTKLVKVSRDHNVSVKQTGDRWHVWFAGIFYDSDMAWSCCSPAGGLNTEEEAVALMNNEYELIRRYG